VVVEGIIVVDVAVAMVAVMASLITNPNPVLA
jgi:hypothetical protein